MNGDAMTETAPPPKNPDTDAPTPNRRASRRRWLWVLLFASIVFASGAVTGTGLTLLVIRDRVLHAIHHPETAPERITQRLRRVLDLDDTQAARIEQILRSRQENLQEIRQRVQPEVMAELRRVEDEVAQVLRPEQREIWEARVRQLRETWVPALPEETEP
jgi:hypothetical protein